MVIFPYTFLLYFHDSNRGKVENKNYAMTNLYMDYGYSLEEIQDVKFVAGCIALNNVHICALMYSSQNFFGLDNTLGVESK